ncbi:deoxyguanosinetriphosphate triphosphohydrolase [Sphingorhabdus lutea]|uniref:Deoxyguanosinetriphosphate triphosphohydrolase-like protein n=1 Tax=Sphingorhabdus lutea TaxID=1913578 RepID=A0A1L3JCV8_9SPHN|nr:deoxyguanosinetriphosphate triphosphohydrolase [Sphingorhabdus lutea]APG62964.1 deoxyguanosinetriphosphate triphosphohydrolase [Sphingorhabdus lutea]
MSQMNRAAYASNAEYSKGRLVHEGDDRNRGPRNIFQRDRDRIIHSISFRRLGHKTQVFVAPGGDHYRVRLTHSLEVAQIGRTIARILGLDEDLTEALCLAHDIGHPPFGHAGEDALQKSMEKYGGFDHNAQTIRTLMILDSPYIEWQGLNLSWELLEGLTKHNGPIKRPSWALEQANKKFDFHLDQWPSLEAQVAAIADDIAYDNHDIDDGIRAGLLEIEDLFELPFVEARWNILAAKYPHAAKDKLIAEFIREQIGAMVNDVILTTRQNIERYNISSLDDVRQCGVQIVTFSPEMKENERALKKFMYRRLYHHPQQLAAAEKAAIIISNIMDKLLANPALLPNDWYARLPSQSPDRQRHIADFLAGMTDRYAQKYHEKIMAI